MPIWGSGPNPIGFTKSSLTTITIHIPDNDPIGLTSEYIQFKKALDNLLQVVHDKSIKLDN